MTCFGHAQVSSSFNASCRNRSQSIGTLLIRILSGVLWLVITKTVYNTSFHLHPLVWGGIFFSGDGNTKMETMDERRRRAEVALFAKLLISLYVIRVTGVPLAISSGIPTSVTAPIENSYLPSCPPSQKGLLGRETSVRMV